MIRPDWPAPANVLAVSTERQPAEGMVAASTGDFARFNLGDHVGDRPDAVSANRGALLGNLATGGVEGIQWLRQVHGTTVFPAPLPPADDPPPGADAAITGERGLALAIMTADCLPVLFCDRAGTQVAAAHAGWRGLCQGVLANTVAAFSAPPESLLAWMGPAISQQHFEVGGDVKAAFLEAFSGPSQAEIETCFLAQPGGGDKFRADLYQLARLQLKSCGLAAIYGGQHCTFAESERFYSYRRQPRCGRQASLIALV